MGRPTRLSEASDSMQEALKSLEAARRHLGAAAVSLYPSPVPGAGEVALPMPQRALEAGSRINVLVQVVADLADDVDALPDEAA